ncbi:unnamed protein product [Spirodela intermedia]|uniref:Uncharacterized protein n=1 Tax=Spirodela intermedia TaxID=51605 RepID=A0A7I8IBS7_SPIIN|nr:unnamed protein product [Spirodela intermedia]CAA6655020.1 unnamed protein product [Spirodela intermedia]
MARVHELISRGCEDGGDAQGSRAFPRISEREEDEHGRQHEKKSVLAKVKDKAKRWRRTLSKRKQGHNVGNDDRLYDTGLGEHDGEGPDPEYHGAAMCESTSASVSYRETPAPPEITADRTEKGTEGPDDSRHVKDRNLREDSDSAPPFVADKHMMQSTKIPGYPVGEDRGSNSPTKAATGCFLRLTPCPRAATGDQARDKGISVKEYLLLKLEPQEEDKALSEVITEAMSPRKGVNGGELGMEKLKDVVTSLFFTERSTKPQPASSEIPWEGSDSKDPRPGLASSGSRPLSVSASPQPLLSSNPRPTPPSSSAQPDPLLAALIKERSNERVLQAYAN